MTSLEWDMMEMAEVSERLRRWPAWPAAAAAAAAAAPALLNATVLGTLWPECMEWTDLPSIEPTREREVGCWVVDSGW